jgi:hypothetical protein
VFKDGCRPTAQREGRCPIAGLAGELTMSKTKSELDGLTDEELFVKAMREHFYTLNCAHERIRQQMHILLRKPSEAAILFEALLTSHKLANSTYAQLIELRERAAKGSKDSEVDNSNIGTPNDQRFTNLGTKTPN